MDLDKVRKRFLPMSETMFYILFSLREERHGYGIMQHVQSLTSGRISLGASTLYQSLAKLEGDGLILQTAEIERKKFYLATDAGRVILQEEALRISELYRNVAELLPLEHV